MIIAITAFSISVMVIMVILLRGRLLVNHPQIGISQVDDGFFPETTLAPSDEQGKAMFDQDLVLHKT